MTPYDVWAEIDLKALSGNIRKLKGLLKGPTRFMAVVKADAYGHGAIHTARQAVSSGVDALGVARLGEAVELRHAGISVPILIFGKTPPQQAGKLVAYDLTQTVWSRREAAELSARALAIGRSIKAHVKIDTGMGRLGMPAGPGSLPGSRLPSSNGASSGDDSPAFGDVVDDICAIHRLEGLACEGIYTHFASADDADKRMASQQLTIFHRLLDSLEKRGVRFDVRHAANSAAVIDMPETHLDMVRAGISMYGYYPSKAVNHQNAGLVPVMTLKSRIVQLKTVGTGFTVSYGATAKTVRQTTIATVAIGYADGYSRLLSAGGKMTVRGRLVPVLGRVCMDYTMIDVGDVPDVAVGDEVTVFGGAGTNVLTAEWLADKTGTIHYEVLTSVSKRVCRLYA